MKIGDKVIDKNNIIGTIVCIDSIHDIEVEYDGGIGKGLYCSDKKCKMYDELTLVKEHKCTQDYFSICSDCDDFADCSQYHSLNRLYEKDKKDD